MFDSARNVRAVTIAMRGPKEWSYFGINEAVLIAAGNEPFMLISGVTSEPDEQCLTAQGSGVGVSSCIAAIASGQGREVFQFNSDGQLAHGDDCVVVEGGMTAGGGAVGLGDCEQALRAGDGRICNRSYFLKSAASASILREHSHNTNHASINRATNTSAVSPPVGNVYPAMDFVAPELDRATSEACP